MDFSVVWLLYDGHFHWFHKSGYLVVDLVAGGAAVVVVVVDLM